jgi:hypothetical protein
MNPVPATVTVVAAAPATAEEGETELTVGLGFVAVGGGVVFDDPPPPPPHAVRKMPARREIRRWFVKLGKGREHGSENIRWPLHNREQMAKPRECKTE